MNSPFDVRTTIASALTLALAACGGPEAKPPPTSTTIRVTYESGIRQLVELRCGKCHGPTSPTMAEFDKDKQTYKDKKIGPRYDTFENLMVVVNGTDTGALMRRLDDGTNTKDGQAGNMYANLGDSSAERASNLSIMKRWVGGWTLKRAAEISAEERAAILAPRN